MFRRAQTASPVVSPMSGSPTSDTEKKGKKQNRRIYNSASPYGRSYKVKKTPERERNIGYTDEKLETNQIYRISIHQIKKTKFLDPCTIDANTEQTTPRTAKFAAS